MSDSKLPKGFTPILPESDWGKKLEKLKGVDISRIVSPKIDTGHFTLQMEQRNREMAAILDEIVEDKQLEEAAEEAYRQEIIRSLRAIEQNTANLQTLVDLINKSNDQQDELIAIITEILTIAKAMDKKEAESIYKKVMAMISQTVKDGETLAKVVSYATAVYELTKRIIENLKS